MPTARVAAVVALVVVAVVIVAELVVTVTETGRRINVYCRIIYEIIAETFNTKYLKVNVHHD